MNRTKSAKPIDSFVDRWRNKKGNLIMILHDIQDYYGYVPKPEAYKLSKELKVPLARIYEVLTFYNYFNLNPPGKHKVSICMGTACYLKGAPELLYHLKRTLNVEEGKSTEDGLFQLEVVRCLGCCGLAPVVMIDDKVHGKITPGELKELILNYQKEG